MPYADPIVRNAYFRKRWATLPRVREARQRWLAKNKDRMTRLRRECYERNKDRYDAVAAAAKKANPVRYAANYAVQTALRRGEIVKPSSYERCPFTGKLDAHHPDYAKPLDVVWLCRSCHKKEHV